MILKIELENFYSIKEKVCIDFRAANINTSKARDLAHNTFKWKDAHILKSIGLFGPNASGKSNIIKAINFCCRLILDSHLNNEGVQFGFEPFKFYGCTKKPSRFLIDFVCEDIEYEYSFELTKSGINQESLYYYPQGRRARLFTRDESLNKPYVFSEGAFVKPSDVADSTTRANLFLSRASSMKREKAQTVYRYFLNTFLLSIVPVTDYNTIAAIFNKYQHLLLTALNICDSDICFIKMVKEKSRRLTQHPDGVQSVPEIDTLRFLTYHKHSPTVSFDMDSDESNGTRKLFYLLLSLLDVARNKKSLMADEFDLNLHTRLAEFVLDMVHASPASQMLFTSHNTNLINTAKLRRDQIVFVNKKSNGSTEIYALYDFKDFRENMDAEKGYQQGRFDAIPYVDSSVTSLKKLLEG